MKSEDNSNQLGPGKYDVDFNDSIFKRSGKGFSMKGRCKSQKL